MVLQGVKNLFRICLGDMPQINIRGMGDLAYWAVPLMGLCDTGFSVQCNLTQYRYVF